MWRTGSVMGVRTGRGFMGLIRDSADFLARVLYLVELLVVASRQRNRSVLLMRERGQGGRDLDKLSERYLIVSVAGGPAFKRVVMAGRFSQGQRRLATLELGGNLGDKAKQNIALSVLFVFHR